MCPTSPESEALWTQTKSALKITCGLQQKNNPHGDKKVCPLHVITENSPLVPLHLQSSSLTKGVCSVAQGLFIVRPSRAVGTEMAY